MMGGAGAASAFATFLAAYGDDDEEESPSGAGSATEKDMAVRRDLEILQYALTLEHLETDFYNAVIDAGVIADKALAKTATMIRDHEQEHVEALMTTIEDLGGTPVKAPGVHFGDAFSGQRSFLALAQTFEDTGVSAYNGAAPAIESKEVLGAVGSIVQVEARHAAAIRALNGAPPADGGFDKSLEMRAVLEAVQPFVRS
jgi:rubrerythrin